MADVETYQLGHLNDHKHQENAQKVDKKKMTKKGDKELFYWFEASTVTNDVFIKSLDHVYFG